MAPGEFFQQSPHATQIDQGASLPFSLPSQPPDIGNWFSSYEYESPDCSDSLHLLEDASEELLNDSAEEDTISTKEEKLVENGNPSFSEQTSQNEYSLELNSFAPEGRNYLTFDHESALKSITEDETIGTNDIWPSEFCPTQKNEYLPIIKKKNYESLHNISNQNGVWQCEEGLRKHDDCDLMSKHGGRSNEEQKENVEMKAENGFISTRNRDGAKKHREISKPQCLIVNGKRSRIELQDDNVVLEKEQPLSARGVLAEKTNVCFSEEAIRAEAPGKWTCPRNSKPYAGPPLKQLRLERWLHREV